MMKKLFDISLLLKIAIIICCLTFAFSVRFSYAQDKDDLVLEYLQKQQQDKDYTYQDFMEDKEAEKTQHLIGADADAHLSTIIQDYNSDVNKGVIDRNTSLTDYANTYSEQVTKRRAFLKELASKIEENRKLCEALKKQQKIVSESGTSLGGGYLPDSVLMNIYQTTKKIHLAVSLVSVLGDALMCHAVHTDPKDLGLLGITFLTVPNIPVWISGAVIYFFGFMFILSITFYIVDISFKLGFAILMLPIGIALWPFSITADKLTKLIIIILKSAAIFAFLAITVSYAVNMLSAAIGGIDSVFEDISNSNTDRIKEIFSLFSMSSIVILFALIYGFKLISATIPDYVDKFFPDNVFGGQSSSPMHHMATQTMDFAKKKVAQPALDLAKDFTTTQAGKATVKAGNLLNGQYNAQIKRTIMNPKESLEKLQLATGKKLTDIITGTMRGVNTVKYGFKSAKTGLQQGVNDFKYGAGKLRTALKDQTDPNTQFEKLQLQREHDQRHQELSGQHQQDKMERKQANEHISQTVEQNYENARKDIDKRIDDKEQKHRQEHERLMQTDPAYRQSFETNEMLKKPIKGFSHFAGSVLTSVGEELQHHDKRRYHQPTKEELDEEDKRQREADALLNRREDS